MISRIRGTLASVSELRVEVENRGVFYEIMVPSYLASDLVSKKGEEVELFTHHFLEGGQGASSLAPRLVGFLSEGEKEFYSHLVKVPGMGSRMVLKAMTVAPAKIARAIETEDRTALAELPGLGKRTADKVIAALKGKLSEYALPSEEDLSRPPLLGEMEEDAVQVLLQLSYKRSEAENMVRIVTRNVSGYESADEIVQAVFKQVGTGAAR